jgi:hypothetical protein
MLRQGLHEGAGVLRMPLPLVAPAGTGRTEPERLDKSEVPLEEPEALVVGVSKGVPGGTLVAYVKSW